MTYELGTKKVHRGREVTLVAKQLPGWALESIEGIHDDDVDDFLSGVQPASEIWVEDAAFVDPDHRCNCPNSPTVRSALTRAPQVYWWDRVNMRSGLACSACRRMTEERKVDLRVDDQTFTGGM